MSEQDAVTVIMCRIGGLVPPDGQAVLNITALKSTPDYIREALVADGIKQVQREFPTAQDVKLITSWAELELFPAEQED